MTNEIIIREYEPGDPSQVAYLHMKFYAEQYGFKGIFEYYVLKTIVEFLENPSGGQLWVAVQDNTVKGSIAVVRHSETSAQLRWLVVDKAVQGRGVGNKLWETALRFCDEQGYVNLHLLTANMLDTARHIYKKHGFTLAEAKENTTWADYSFLVEKWERC
ncbi:MAG: GNAT family N-acetyltransferase [Defluviitaleaceae bacterium]|nr:GNAT family N-acetyltransferase [Defluviitaleaceae bacterium]